MSIISRAKAVFLRAGTESMAREANRRSYRRTAQRVNSETTLTQISDLAAGAGLKPATLTLAALLKLEAVGS